GNGGKWQTPHQQAKLASRSSGKIEPGDAGIWATCARGVERKAAAELKAMLEECAERFYGLKSAPDEPEGDENSDDIEAVIKKELASMDQKKDGNTELFTQIHMDLQCVLFFKTRSGIDPVDFAHKICEEIVANPKIRRMRYINRLTPMTLFGKATEKGLEDLSKSVLGNYFKLNTQNGEGNNSSEDNQSLPTNETSQDHANYSYAIRPTIRNHNTLKRDAVIKQIASSIADTHKVDLTNAEKVIVVDIYQTVCGMSVVGGDWEALKRFNLAELYSHGQSTLNAKAASDAEAKLQSVATIEGAGVATTDNTGP
ncbi:uncharacterized protein LY89DRAFT_596078, partial [Mollisia scopiformis]